MRLRTTFSLPENFNIDQLLNWAEKYSPVLVLNSNKKAQNFIDPYSKFEILAAIGSIDQLTEANDFFTQADTHLKVKDWHFGHLSYDLKNDLEDLHSNHPDHIQFSAAHFFRPRWVLYTERSELHIEYDPQFDSGEQIQQLAQELFNTKHGEKLNPVHDIQTRVTEKEYISNVLKIQEHIQRGDIYEMNYCIEFFAENAHLRPALSYSRLNTISPMPFSCFYKMNDHYLLCASPERFIAKRGNKLISQPIKGTAKRGDTLSEDEKIRQDLYANEKERSENVMIVDLVRNDLSRTAARGTVKVEELFGIYSFQSLHQMISTVVSELNPEYSGLDAIRFAFPMGSMTGAPKVRAMQLIEEFESTKRGLYSGAVGYIDPNGDFDFNVVIRSIQYNAITKYISFMVGSAITIGSDAEKEYRECLLKAESMMLALNPDH